MCPSTFEAPSIFSTLPSITKTGTAPPFTHLTAQSLCSALAPLAPHFESEIQPVNSSARAETANSESRRIAAVMTLFKMRLLCSLTVSITYPASTGNTQSQSVRYLTQRTAVLWVGSHRRLD